MIMGMKELLRKTKYLGKEVTEGTMGMNIL